MKLVRDNIPAIILEKQSNCAYAQCQDRELLKRLLDKKLFEESKEFIDAYLMTEAADIATVLYYLYINGVKDYDDGPSMSLDEFFTELKKAVKKKLDSNGGFEKGYILLDREDYECD